MERFLREDMPRSPEPLRTTRRLYRIDRRDISFLRFILEAYDGMAVVTTEDASRGIVSITMAPGCETIVADVINALAARGEIFMEPLTSEAPADYRQGCACTSST